MAAANLALGSGTAGAATRHHQRVAVLTSAPDVTISEFPAFGGSWLEQEASDQGFFKKNGLNVKLVVTTSSSEGFAAVASGSINVLTASPEGVLPVIEKGTKLRAITTDSSNPWSVTVNNTIPKPKKSFPQSLAELKGKTLGISGFGSSSEYITESLMAKAGLTYPADYKLAATGGTSTTIAALESNEIQGSVEAEPTTPAVQSVGKGYQFASAAEVSKSGPTELAPGRAYTDLWALDSYISAHPKIVTEIQKAMAEAYVWAKNPHNLAAAEKVSESFYGHSVPSGQLKAVTTASIDSAQSWLTESDLATSIAFDHQYKFITGPISAASIYHSGPNSEAEAAKLASK